LGHVRKDILNGWKEIGGYVCRDIRTVERWEKQRGLPVRRVPGAGRATVYALISELDEWLENTNTTASQNPDPSLDTPPSETIRIGSAVEPLDRSRAPRAFEPTATFTTHAENGRPDQTRPFAAPARSSPYNLLRKRWIAAAALTVAAGMACVLAAPVIRNRAKPRPESTPKALIPAGGTRPVPYRSPVPGVDDLYLRGVYSSEQRTPESLQHSLQDFSAAAAKDPSYAPAYVGLANTYNLLREYSVMPDAEAYPKAKEAAQHAIALDPTLPEAHASLGFIDFFWSWDPTQAEHEFQTALALDPNSGLAHHWYGSMLMHEGRLNDAMKQLDIAQRLEPTSAAILSTRALAIGLDGHRGEAVDMLQDVINETPGVSSPHAILATLSIITPRDPARYLTEMKYSGELRHNIEALQVTAKATHAYQTGGEQQMWAAILAAEERHHPGAEHRTYRMAEAETILGRNDAAIADLTQLAARHDPAMIGIVIDPALAQLHSDKRFAQIVVSVGLPPLTH
jgi:Tfp pilus assembly protein PilF